MARAELLLQIVAVKRSKNWYRELNSHWIFCCHRSGDFLRLESVSVESRRNITAYTSSRQNPAKPRGWVDRVFITICASSLEFLCPLKQTLINFSLAAVKHFGRRCRSYGPHIKSQDFIRETSWTSKEQSSILAETIPSKRKKCV